MSFTRRCAVALSCFVTTVCAGCSPTYCQSGSKYGTQCYSMNEVEYHVTQTHGEIDDRRPPFANTPSPGCTNLLNGESEPQPGKPGPSIARKTYLVSGACVHRVEPAYGAIR